MTKFTLEKHVAAPPEVLFDTVLDLRSAAENIRAIEKLEVLTEGPIGVGTRFRETRTVFKKQATEVMEIKVLERPSRYALAAESHGSKYVTSYDFVREGTGTKLILTFQSEPQTVAAKLMGVVFSLMQKALMRMVEHDLDDLAAVAEGRSREGAAKTPGAP